MSKTILVTGANGLLGNALFSQVNQSKSFTFVATGRGERRAAVPPHISYYSCDLSNDDEVKGLLNNVKPDVVIHGAAMTQVDHCETNPNDCMRANVDATEHLLKHGSAHMRMVFISTDFIFDGARGMYKEDDVPNPVSVYGKSKLIAEECVRNAGRSYAILRTMLVYGYAPNLSRSNIVLWVVESLQKNKPIRVVNDQFRGPTLVDNLAKAALLAADSTKNGSYHISSTDYISMYDFALKIAKIWGLNAALITPIDTATLGQPAARPPKTGFVVDKAIQNLGFRPVSVDEGLRTVLKRMADV